MLQKIRFIFISTLCSLATTAQQPKQAPVIKLNPQQPIAVQPSFTFKKLSSGLQYAFIIDKPTLPKLQEGDQISINMQSVCNNRIMYNSYQALKGKPAVYGVTKPAFKGDLIEGIMLMTPGDSLVCMADAEAIFKGAKSKMPDYIKPGDKIQYFIKLVSVKSKEQLQKEQQAAFQKQMNEQMAKQRAAAAKQIITDDKLLKGYFIKNKITPEKTASGLYYIVKEEGGGEKAVQGDSIVMNYTGTLLDGTKFDSNEDTAFHHVQPFQFVLGRGAVIKGWDEGVALLKTGTKATFYIPSGLAYGAQARPGGGANPKGIPANSILQFDVHLVKATHPAPAVVSPIPNKDSIMAAPLAPSASTDIIPKKD